MEPGADNEVSAQLLVFAEQTNDFVGVSDPWGRILYLNPAARKRLGVSDATDLTLADVFPLDAFNFYYEVVRPELLRSGTWSGEVLVNVAGGGAVPMYISTSARLGPGGETNGGVVYARELTASDRSPVADASDLDTTTGLLHPPAFENNMRLALDVARRDDDPCALVLVDIVGMHDAIETFGVLTAANVTRSLAGRLTRLARTIDIAGHVDDHRFGLLLRGVRSHGEALRIGQMAHEALVDPPVTTAGGEVVASVGCGVAFSRPGDEPVDLIERASAAMSFEPPNRDLPSRVLPNRDFALHEPPAVTERPEASPTLDELRVGLSHGDVRPYAQPVVDLASGLVIGYRGLARWHHRRLGSLGASEFIEMIAETPLANQVDLYIARETAAVLALSLGDVPLRLYAPVSKRLVSDVRTEQYLSEIADAFFLTMHQVRLQIARPLLDNWTPALRDALQSLRDADVALVLTGVEHVFDVGAFAEHEFDELHISRRLTNAATTDSVARRVVSEIVRLTREGPALVGAAGVDRPEHRDVVADLGCDIAIGDLFGSPRPANTID